DLDAVGLEEPRAERRVVDALGDDDGSEHRHLGWARRLTVELETERGEPRDHGLAGRPVSQDARVEALVEYDPERFRETIDHRGRGGVVIQTLRAPVAIELREVEIVRADGGAPPGQPGGDRVRVRDRSEARRATEALLRAGRDDVELPGVRLERCSREGAHG